MMRPPFEISHETLRRVAGVERLLGRYEGLHSPRPLPRLRRSHRVRTIHDSLAIEGNTLTLKQATTVLEGKRVAAPARDILELQNANAAFVEFGTAVVEEALKRFLGDLKPEPSTASHRIEIAAGHLAGREFSRKDYSAIFPSISTATASRDLRHGIDSGRLQKSGEKALTRYRFA